jgi:hypothetical protein
VAGLLLSVSVAGADKVVQPTSLLRADGGGGEAPDGVPTAQLDVDVSGAQSIDLLGDPQNEVRLIPIGANAVVTGVGWDVIINSIPNSWNCEAVVRMSDSAQVYSIDLTPGSLVCAPGSAQYSSPIVDFTDIALANIQLGADGLLRLEFFETFNDFADAVDATWDPPSTLTFAYVGEGQSVLEVPALGRIGLVTLVVVLAGLSLFLLARRRRAA